MEARKAETSHSEAAAMASSLIARRLDSHSCSVLAMRVCVCVKGGALRETGLECKVGSRKQEGMKPEGPEAAVS